MIGIVKTLLEFLYLFTLFDFKSRLFPNFEKNIEYIPSDILELEEKIESIYFDFKQKLNWKKFSKIVVLGDCIELGPNYFFRLTFLSKLLTGNFHRESRFIFSGLEINNRITAEMLKIYNTKLIFLSSSKYIFFNLYFCIISFFMALDKYYKLQNPSKLLDLKIKHIKVGDLIYDSVLKKNNLFTIDTINHLVFREIFQAHILYFQFKKNLLKFTPDYLITSHIVYVEFGIAVRIAKSIGINILESTDLLHTIFGSEFKYHEINYHSALKNKLKNLILIPDDNKISDYDELIEKRLEAKFANIDAYTNFSKPNIEPRDIRTKYDINSHMEIMSIFPHIFSDSPHSSSNLLFNDYYTFLESTIKFASKNSNVFYFVRPHPMGSFAEYTAIRSIVRDSNAPNIKLFGSDFSGKSLLNISNYVCTAQGSVGLEAAALGIPVVLVGDAFYSGLGFTYDCVNIGSFMNYIKNPHLLNALNKEQIARAKKTFYIWHQVCDFEKNVFTAEFTKLVWSGNKREALKILLLNLNAEKLAEMSIFSELKVLP